MNRVLLFVLVALVAVLSHGPLSVSASFATPTPLAQSQASTHYDNKFHQGMNTLSPEELEQKLSSLSLSESQQANLLWQSNFDPRRVRAQHPASRDSARAAGAPYLVGAGIWDVTGEVAEIGFMGYATPLQKGAGLLFRSRARAFIMADVQNPSTDRVVYVSLDLCMGFQMVKDGVIDLLQAEFGPSLYTHANVIISGTHTHATPGGIGGHPLVDLTTLGFIKPNYEAAVQGIYNAIRSAHSRLALGNIFLNAGELNNTNANRSPSAYLLNKDRQQYNANTDHEMTVLRFEYQNGTELGLVAFYAVHGTSLNNTNMLVSGDNKGYASIQTEKIMNGEDVLPGLGPFVAAFGQANEGDVSPNTLGAVCIDTGKPCDFVHSSCPNAKGQNRSQNCIASGPGADMYESMRMIGNQQSSAALGLYRQATIPLSGSIAYRHQYYNMENITVGAQFSGSGQPGQTCIAALGYSFASGTTDGPGDFDFLQGTTNVNPFWNWVVNLICPPTQEQMACQHPKPILLDVGLTKPIKFSDTILPEQLVKVGDLYILAVPGEFTTMSGRRLRGMVQQALIQAGQWTPNSHVVIAGLSNAYSHYIATYEEYQQQRYEAASTLYGQYTLGAHIQNFNELVGSVIAGTPLPDNGLRPMDMRNHTFSFMPGVIVDTVPANASFGSLEKDANTQQAYSAQQWVNVTFWGANPRNTLQTQQSFLYVDYFNATLASWQTVAVDGSDNTVFHWKRVGVSQSLVTVCWLIPPSAKTGTYRIRHQGARKKILGTVLPYEGVSSQFKVNV